MKVSAPDHSRTEAFQNARALKKHPYTGNLIAMGPNIAGDRIYQALCMLGQTPNEHRRRLVISRAGAGHYLSTVAYAENGEESSRQATMRRVSLLVQRARLHVVTTGSQTDQVARHLALGSPLAEMPQLTGPENGQPRLTAYLKMGRNLKVRGHPEGNVLYGFIARRQREVGKQQKPIAEIPVERSLFRVVEAGVGVSVMQYGPTGAPFSSLPMAVPLEATPEDTLEGLRDLFNPAHLVSIAIKTIGRSGAENYHISNTYNPE